MSISSDLLAEVFTTLVLNHSSSLSTENPSNPGVLTHRMKLGVTYVPVVFGQVDRIHSLMWVFYPNASFYCNKDLAALYKLNENAKKSEYGERVQEVEHAVFTPLVLSTCGGKLCETTTFYKKRATDLAARRKLQYGKLLGWLRCSISFVLLRSAIMAICGSRSSSHNAAPADIPLASREGNVPRLWELGCWECWQLWLSYNNRYHFWLHSLLN